VRYYGCRSAKKMWPNEGRSVTFCPMRFKPLISVELFSGAGGLALGVANAGFSHRLLLEYNKHACATLRENRQSFGSECEIHEGDVKAYEFSRLGAVDLLAAGAPCQPFSIAGKHKAHSDDRNLFPQVFRAVRELRPRAIVVENVKGLLRDSLAEFVEYIELQLASPLVTPKRPLDADSWVSHLRVLRQRRGAEELEYSVFRVLLNAADFGVAQRRERVFFVALRSDVANTWIPPKASHSQAALKLATEVTGKYWQRHGVRRRSLASHPRRGEWERTAGNTAPWVTVRDALGGLPSPQANELAGQIANHVAQAGARSYPGHTGSPLDEPAKTLKAGVHGVPGGENMIRNPNGTVRYFTVREAARIQSFPDTYRFTGAWGEAMRQIGNAVPVRLAEAVALSVRNALVAPVRLDDASRPRVLPRTPSQRRASEQEELLLAGSA
jgi:DNA (cytosine-5)-methyltransferase 1